MWCKGSNPPQQRKFWFFDLLFEAWKTSQKLQIYLVNEISNRVIRKVTFHSTWYLAGGGAPPLNIYGSHQLCCKGQIRDATKAKLFQSMRKDHRNKKKKCHIFFSGWHHLRMRTDIKILLW
jgi:hypothetical protein